MKKKLFLIILAVAVCIAAILYFFFHSGPKGNTTASREEILNTSLAKGREWKIAKETELDGYLVCGAYSTDDKAALAVFAPTGSGNYKFYTSTTRNSDEIIIGGAILNDAWYDLIWFHGAATEYAEVTYTITGQAKEHLRYDTADMEIICCENPEKEYSIHVIYYDGEGNTYE